MNLKRMLETAADRYGEKTAIVSGDGRLSYSDLDSASNRMADGLLKIGIKRGDRVALMLPNSPEFIIACFGIVKIGAVVVPLDPKYKVAELDALLADFLPRVLVTDSPTLELLAPCLPRYKSIEFVIDLDSGQGKPFLPYDELIAGGSENRIAAEPDPDDTAFIFYTSGASFTPRGAMLSHRAMAEEAKILGDGFGQTDKDVMMLFALPMSHVFGLVAVMLNVVCKGSSLVIVPGTGLSIGSFMAAIEREKGTMFLGIPYIFALAVDMAEKQGMDNDLSSLRLCCSSGDFLPADVAEKFRQLYGHTIIDGLALTEAVCHVTCMPIDGSGQPGSVGKALPGWQVKTVDENGAVVPCNRIGEIIVKGPIMKGYYNNPRATAEVIRDGWFYTGDMGKIDGDGVLYYTGREKDIIILKGQNIVPDDIESVLCKHPGIAEAAVFGIPDKMRGEIVGAAIELKAGETVTEQDIRKFCQGYMTDYKAPKKIFFQSSLPKTAEGKIDKTALRVRLSVPPLFPEAAVS